MSAERNTASVRPSALRRTLARTVDFLLPPRCIATGETVAEHGTLSPAFWSELVFIEEPCCETCGIPFPFEATMGALCASCLENAPVFDRARAAVVYNDASRKLVIDFKYGDRLHAVDTLAPWMRRAGAALLAESDLLIPVPLHSRRLWRRRFNQSALLARALGASTGKPALPDGLLRLRHTVQQKGLSRKERKENVKNAFAVNGRHLARIAGRNVLLIDDVFTSGATLNECARTLKKHGAEKVNVLTVARVTREEFAF
ncbi:MAG: ComF family protein [Alphaproteobacteria bacterium]|nr:ComF family protein [Alphaproteobacteria bacterium]